MRKLPVAAVGVLILAFGFLAGSYYADYRDASARQFFEKFNASRRQSVGDKYGRETAYRVGASYLRLDGITYDKVVAGKNYVVVYDVRNKGDVVTYYDYNWDGIVDEYDISFQGKENGREEKSLKVYKIYKIYSAFVWDKNYCQNRQNLPENIRYANSVFQKKLNDDYRMLRAHAHRTEDLWRHPFDGDWGFVYPVKPDCY